MDAKIEIKVEEALTDNIASQNELEFFTKVDTMKTNGCGMLLDDNYGMAVKTEIITPPDFCSPKQKECLTKHFVKQIESETVKSSNNCEIDMKTEIEEQTVVSGFGSQNEREFLPEDPVMKVKEFSDHETDIKIEIKEEPWWLETETSSVCDDIKDGDFSALKSSRLCVKAEAPDIHINLHFPSAEVLGRDISFDSKKDHTDCVSQESDVTEIPAVEEYSHSEQSGKCDGQLHSRVLCPKQNNLINNNKMDHTCNVCVSDIKSHELFPRSKRPYMCKSCDNSFTTLSSLKRHNLIHEGKRPHQCKTCGKSFTQCSDLKRHYLIHECKKSQCKNCERSLTQLSHLKEKGKRPHQYKTGEQGLSGFEQKNLIHEGKRPHHCKICDKSFTQLSSLKRHYVIHEGKRPYQCVNCEKNFTQLSHLKTHSLIHEGKRRHQCKICYKRFTRLSHLKGHSLIHEGKRPYKCNTCHKNFTQSSSLKRHYLTHEGKRLYQCKTCDKSFIQLSNLKRHKLFHECERPHSHETCD